MSNTRVYETTLIINAAIEDNDVDAAINKVTGYIENHGGEVEEVNRWGRRRLAYPINKKFNGFYVHIVFKSLPANIPLLERFLVLEDTILRHLTLVLSDKLRDFRAEKAKEEGSYFNQQGDDDSSGDKKESDKKETKANSNQKAEESEKKEVEEATSEK